MIKLAVNAPARMHHRFPRALAIALAVLAGALLPADPASPGERPDPTLRQELNFRVSRFPTFIVIDHEGVVVFRHSGWGNRISGRIDREVGRAVSKAVKARKRAEAD